MNRIENLWQEVAHRTALAQPQELAALRAFLLTLNCNHALALTGREMHGSLDTDSAEVLEAEVLNQVRMKGGLPRETAASWLRMLYIAQKIYSNTFGKVECYTRLAVMQAPQQSPFSPDLMRRSRPAVAWRSALENWLTGLKQRSPIQEEWQAGIVLSAALYGGLIDQQKLIYFMSAISKPLPTCYGKPYLAFHQTFQGLGDFHCQRWFLDPVSELLSYRRPNGPVLSDQRQLMKAIQALLGASGLAKQDCPASLKHLAEVSAADWSMRASRLDLEIMKRGVIAHSFHDHTWERLFNCEALPKHSTRDNTCKDNVAPSAIQGNEWRLDVEMFFNWWSLLRHSIAENQHALEKYIEEFQTDDADTSSQKIYVGWLAAMLAGKNSTRKQLSFKTVSSYALSAIPLLLSLIGDANPANFGEEELSDLYQEAMAACPSDTSERTLAKALREFHTYLVRQHSVKALASVRAILGDDAGLEPVDANVLSVDEYFEAREHLNQLEICGRDPEQIMVAKLVMMLAFRGGLRRMEIFGLRIADISSIRHLEILVLEHEGRRLKTKSSQRIIPIRFLLTSTERRELRNWIRRRMAEEQSHLFSPYLFALPNLGQARVSSETISDRIIASICAVTGRNNTKIHQLRHSFGTWLYLALRAPEYPGIEQFFETMPKTRRFILQGVRLRKCLGVAAKGTSRMYAFSVSRLLGHSSPLVSFGHYIHSNEFVHYQIAVNALNHIRQKALFGVADVSDIWGRRLIKPGLQEFMKHCRRQYLDSAEKDARGDPGRNIRKEGGRPPKTSPSGWLSLTDLHGFIHLCSMTQERPEDIAIRIGLPSEKARIIIEKAEELTSRFGLPTIPNSALPDIPFPRTQAEISWNASFERRLKRGFAIDPELAIDGIAIHLSQFNHQKGDVVFHGKQEFDTLKIYSEFLKKMSVVDQSIEVVIRSSIDIPIPGWARRRLKTLGHFSMRRVIPPVKRKTNPYADWVGIMIIDEHGGHPTFTRGAMLLATIGWHARTGDGC